MKNWLIVPMLVAIIAPLTGLELFISGDAQMGPAGGPPVQGYVSGSSGPVPQDREERPDETEVITPERLPCGPIEYIVGYYGLERFNTSVYPTAASLAMPNPEGLWLERNGFYRMPWPSEGDIIAMQPGALGLADEATGHIGRVYRKPWAEGHFFVITIISAGLERGQRTGDGLCSNVYVSQIRVPFGDGSVSFWGRDEDR